jgi:SAM-dependent methyltransferase
MGSIEWSREIAQVYDKVYADGFAPEVIGPIVEVLIDLAQGGPALEFAVGTGRVALALHARGIEVHGIELSPHMVEQFRAKPGSDDIPVSIGDMATTTVPKTFKLVYPLANTIMNVTTQEEQLGVFANAAAHLEAGGCFVVEVIVPRVPNGAGNGTSRIFRLEPDHVGIETFDDLVGQIAWSHHWMEVDGRLIRHSAPYRYLWPSELDLMARIAGLRLKHRWSDWDRKPFTSESISQVTIYEKGISLPSASSQSSAATPRPSAIRFM